MMSNGLQANSAINPMKNPVNIALDILQIAEKNTEKFCIIYDALNRKRRRRPAERAQRR
jgi:hypothetical protein